jgi:peptidyl-prolyl cis-trans isomerase C
MMRKIFPLCVLAAAAWAADEKAPAKPAIDLANLPPDTIVATVNGKKMTADQVRKMVAGIPAQAQEAFTKDPKQFMQEYAWYINLQAAAEKLGLAEQSPYREILAFNRMLTLVQAEWNHEYSQILVMPDEQKKFYDEHPERFRETQAKMIYIPFTSGSSEDEAKAKAQQAVQQARGGVDFVKLVKEFSQDKASAGQNGDIGMPIRTTTTQIPETMRNAVLALKSGQVSDPVRHENGYYIFRAESAGVLPYEKVKDEIFKELKDVGFNRWKEKTKAQSSVQFDNEAFFQTIKQQAQTKPNGQ